MDNLDLVLLVEDDQSLLNLNVRVLEREGYAALPARTLREARRYLQEYVPQAAVLDVELPDGNGLDFCRELRETRTIPIVILTSRKGEEYEAAGYATGADDYITKPYDIERLTGSMNRLLGRAGQGGM